MQAQHSTGIKGDTVYINDLEDHSWSYYSDSTCPIRSLNPADVTITYYGNGTGTVSTTTNNATPANNSWTANATGVKVGIASGENQNTFVYYKTLERTDGATATSVASATGRCEYTTIPNPFQVRPTYGTDATKWRGFYKWRVKSVSGGTIYDASTGGNTIAAGGTIDAEQTVYFAPTASTGMTVELEALWARAYVVTSNTTSGMQAGVGYERNFMVLTSGNNVSPTQSANYQYTLTSVYPNGTSDGTTATTTKGTTTVRGRQIDQNTRYYSNGGYLYQWQYYHIVLSNHLKIENIAFSTTTDKIITANGYNLVIGRGVTGTMRYVRNFYASNTAYSSVVNNTLRVESGDYTNFFALKDGDDYERNYNGYQNTYTNSRTFSNIVNVKVVLGCDYDRAKNVNNNLTIATSSGNIYGTDWTYFTSESNKENLTFDWNIKSGNLHNGRVKDGGADYSIYLGGASSYQYMGKRRLVVEGGEFANIAGGIGGLTPGSTTTFDNTYNTSTAKDYVYIRLKGGLIHGAIYGAAAYASAEGGRIFVFTGGTIEGWVAGGANGTRTSGGQLYGSTNIYVGGNTIVGNSSGGNRVGDSVRYQETTGGQYYYGLNGADGGNVFGAGCGILPTSSSYTPNENYKNDDYTVGQVTSSHVVIADDATVWRDVYAGGNYGYIRSGGSGNIYILGGTVKGKVYGGSNNQQGQTVNITMKGGTVEGGLYGGSNSWGNINNNITMQIDGGQVGLGSGDTIRQKANIHGGGYGQNTAVSGTVNVTLGTCGTTSGATIYGDVYLGSALGSIGTGTTQTHSITLNKSIIYGGLYGGGLGSVSDSAVVNGDVKVAVTGGKVLTTADDPDGEAGSGSVFGCNNVKGAPTGTVNVDIYGTDTTTKGQTYALHAVYGGGNRSAYSGTPKVTIHGCDNKIEYVYGGGNASNVAGTDVVIWGGTIGNAFGGGNGYSKTGNHTKSAEAHYNPGANITKSNAHLTIHGGTITNVFGGSNQRGFINNEITIDIEPKRDTAINPCDGAAYDSCNMNLTNIYGGGNEAEIRYYVEGSTEGGDWLKQPTVNLPCDIKATSFFGGSKAANYGRSIILNIYYGEFGSVFGGNDQDGIISGNVTVNVYGGKITNVFGGNNEGGNILGEVTVNINEHPDSSTCSNKVFDITNVYGGGYNAKYEPTDSTGGFPQVNIINGTVNNCVYGGGFGTKATVKSCPRVTIGGIDSVTSAAGKKVEVQGNVYGGGNEAAVNGSTTVWMLTGTVGKSVAESENCESGCIFGGGKGNKDNEATAKVFANTRVVLKGGEVMGNVYGGGHLGQVGGNSRVELTTP